MKLLSFTDDDRRTVSLWNETTSERLTISSRHYGFEDWQSYVYVERKTVEKAANDSIGKRPLEEIGVGDYEEYDDEF